MSLNAVNSFRSIRDFPELVNYLGDELDWPIETDDFEEMTFEYSAAELGLDQRTAPKFLEIRRLRPLDKDQPWGIFFIRFDDNKLPVVALRRLLSKLVLKKRATSNMGDRASWHENDLLLISQTGSLGAQSISFAHFAANPEKTDLPILKVLGWDDDDTGLKIDYVIETLREKLVWPDDPSDSEAWRAQWRDAFTLKNREVIQSSKEMAERLGQLALAIRTRLREVLAIESEEGPIHKLMSVFKANLISDLDTDSFSDMYAQTIAYGLLSARIINPKANTADAAHTQIPITNPFLKDLMETFLNVGGRSHSSGVGLDFDELGINEVVDLLDNTNMEAVLRDFGDRNQQEDPVMHFFEGFLQEYDTKIRKDRGVFYTPQPVVSFIVRSVDEQLRTEFGLEDGLADTTTWGELAKRIADLEIPEGTSPDQPFVQILDPATGTGTFPVEVIDIIFKTMAAKWQAQGNREAQIKELWNEYVPKNLLPRLHGYELMMAPYAIAHMKIGLKLYETGYRFKSDERARIYLTNALEPAQDFSGTFAFAIPALAHEAEAVNAIKRDRQFTVIIGNPPYSSVSSNLSLSCRALVEPYKYFDGEKIVERGALQFEKNINDDYVKFLRFAETCVENSPGIIGFITNNGYLEAPTLRGMRQHLTKTFKSMTFVDLHGDADRRERAPDGSVDENVFDIKRGVVIGFFRRNFVGDDTESVQREDLFGNRENKYVWLKTMTTSDISRDRIMPGGKFFLFLNQNHGLASEYSNGISLDELFIVRSSGFESGRDELLLDFTEGDLIKKVDFFSTGSSEQVQMEFSIDKAWGKTLFDKRETMKLDGNNPAKIMPVLMYPFDTRYCFYRKDLLKTNSWSAGQHLRNGKNVALMCMRQVVLDEPISHFGISRSIVNNRAFASQKGKVTYMPLFLDEHQVEGSLLEREETSNLEKSVSRRLFHNEEVEKRTPWDTLCIIVAQLFSSSYRRRYEDFLKRDFPRVFKTRSLDLENLLIAHGAEIIAAQLLEADGTNREICSLVGGGKLVVQNVIYSDTTVWLNKEKSIGFSGVQQDVWDFRIGGYKVCEKWLKDRGPKKGKPGYTLSDDDVAHYQKIIFAVSETIRIAAEIDKSIESHGGWPDAFIMVN